jgi:hypothetical protein
MAPFGAPVVPDVKMMSLVSSSAMPATRSSISVSSTVPPAA